VGAGKTNLNTALTFSPFFLFFSFPFFPGAALKTENGGELCQQR